MDAHPVQSGFLASTDPERVEPCLSEVLGEHPARPRAEVARRTLPPSSANVPISSHRGLSTSESRAPVKVSRRSAATGHGCTSRRLSSAAPRRSSYSRLR